MDNDLLKDIARESGATVDKNMDYSFSEDAILFHDIDDLKKFVAKICSLKSATNLQQKNKTVVDR